MLKNIKKSKKGFTLVELVVVIAVIAILGGVSIAAYMGITSKANESNDVSLVTQLNTALIADKAIGNKHSTMSDALKVAQKEGFDLTKIKSSAKDNEILWDSKNDLFCYFRSNNMEYYPNSGTPEKASDVEYFVVSDKIHERFSTCYIGSETTFTGDKALSRGFDVGSKNNITVIEYKSSSNQTVIINTNGGELKVDAASGTVNHYGYAHDVNIENIAADSYHEFGMSKSVVVTNGHAVVESGAKVFFLDNESTTNANINSGATVLNIKTGTSSKVVNDSGITPSELNEAPMCTGDHDCDVAFKEGDSTYAFCKVCGEKVCLDVMTVHAKNSEEMNEAISVAENGDVICLDGDGTFTLNTSINKGVTIKGNGSVKIDISAQGSIGAGAEVTFDTIIFECGETLYKGFLHSSNNTFKNCQFIGLFQIYEDIAVFENCTFTNLTHEKYSVWIYGGDECLFENCHFFGESRNVYIYQEGMGHDKNVSFKKCDFHQTVGNDKSAVMLNAAGNWNDHCYNVTFVGCSIDEKVIKSGEDSTKNYNYLGLFGLKHLDGHGNASVVRGTVTIDGNQVYKYPNN